MAKTESDLIAEVRQTFGGALPVIFEVMLGRGDLDLYWPLVRRALVRAPAVTEPVFVHALMTVLSTRCSNGYYFVMHAVFLREVGLTEEEISTLVRELRLPAHVKDHERWSRLLTVAFLAAQTDSHGPLAELLELHATAEEYAEIAHVCVVMRALHVYSEFFGDVLDVESETMWCDAAGCLRLEIGPLIKFYTQASPRMGESSERPVGVICADCKRIRDLGGNWYSPEVVLPNLEKNTLFSHTYCPRCLEKVNEELAVLHRERANKRRRRKRQ